MGRQVFSSYVSICERSNICLAPFDVGDDKAFIGKTRGVILGVLFDSEKMTWGYTKQKSARFNVDNLQFYSATL